MPYHGAQPPLVGRTPRRDDAAGWAFMAAGIDVCSRHLLGWQASRVLHTDLALDGLEMVICVRRRDDLRALTHHSGRGVPPLAARYTEWLALAVAVTSVGSRDDRCHSGVAESLTGRCRTALIRESGPWSGVDDAEHATFEYLAWLNHECHHRELGMIPPTEFYGTWPVMEAASQYVRPPSNPRVSSLQPRRTRRRPIPRPVESVALVDDPQRMRLLNVVIHTRSGTPGVAPPSPDASHSALPLPRSP